MQILALALEAIRQTLARLLCEPHFRAAAQAFGPAVRSAGGSLLAARLVERLARAPAAASSTFAPTDLQPLASTA